MRDSYTPQKCVDTTAFKFSTNSFLYSHCYYYYYCYERHDSTTATGLLRENG